MAENRLTDLYERYEHHITVLQQALKDAKTLIEDSRQMIDNLRAEIARLQNEQDARIILDVPYFSQWGEDADYVKTGDCGPAAITGAIHYLTSYTPTVDEVAKAAGMGRDDKWSNFGQLIKACAAFGLTARHVRPLTSERIIDEIQRGRPVLALVKYDVLATPADPNQDDFAGAHFVLIVGVQLGPGPQQPHGFVVYHDPDRLRGDRFGEFRVTPWDRFILALGSTSQTPGNSYDDHGMVFEN